VSDARAYRPELDGLRAIAVIAVLLYHVDLPWIKGGFVGVDVFFVLSGYLITSLLRREIGDGKFRFRDFFVRRVRRLSPALLVLTTFTAVVATFVLLPQPMASFAASVRAQPIALQNMHFLVEGDYFNGSEGKPLLHTWSLGVEEQFYLIWPMVVLLISRFERRAAMAMLAVLIAGSFAINLILMDISPKASFFFLPARAWELGIGALVAMLQERRNPAGAAPAAASFVALGAMVAMCATFVFFDESVAFPGWAALIPVLATAALVDAVTRGAPWMRRALSAAPLVRIGVISYSLYLWHWPLIVFARILGVEPGRPLNALLLLSASYGLAVASHRFVEEPIRRRRVFKTDRALLGAVAAVSIGLLVYGEIGVRTAGYAMRYDGTSRAMLTAWAHAEGDGRCGFLFRVTHPSAMVCQTHAAARDDAGGVLVWGNSHAAMWIGLANELGAERDVSVYLNARNCRPTVDNQFCDQRVQDEVIASIANNAVTDVILAATWHGSYEIADENFEASMTAVVNRLVEQNVRVWLLVDVPQGDAMNPVLRYAENRSSPSFGSIAREIHEQTRRSREVAFFQQLVASHERVSVLDPTEAFCPNGGDCLGGADEVAWYRDADHVTAAGARRARGVFAPVFEASVAR
jgi:peptidoglycan/LPS O-acetylase OafA/YrhL